MSPWQPATAWSFSQYYILTFEFYLWILYPPPPRNVGRAHPPPPEYLVTSWWVPPPPRTQRPSGYPPPPTSMSPALACSSCMIFPHPLNFIFHYLPPAPRKNQSCWSKNAFFEDFGVLGGCKSSPPPRARVMLPLPQ